jgi:hypothetical protein
VHAFEAAREHEDLAERTWLRHQRQIAGIELEDDLVALLLVLEVAGAQGGADQVAMAPSTSSLSAWLMAGRRLLMSASLSSAAARVASAAQD